MTAADGSRSGSCRATSLFLPCLLLLLSLFPSPSHATSSWQFTLASDGHVDLSYAGSPVLTGACPSVGAFSLCDAQHYSGAKAGTPSKGVDARLGPFADTPVDYMPATGTAAPVARLVLRLFGGGDSGAVTRVMQARVEVPSSSSSSSSTFTTNRMSVFKGQWHLPPQVVAVAATNNNDNNTATDTATSTTRTTSASVSSRLRILNVPFDNDVESMYSSVNVASAWLASGTSAYVAALYDDSERHGVVAGFLEHTLWKTGIKYHGGSTSSTTSTTSTGSSPSSPSSDAGSVECVAGINGLLETRDSVPHGDVPAGSPSPWLQLGVYGDWRRGMEDYARSQRGNGGKPAALPRHLPQQQQQQHEEEEQQQGRDDGRMARMSSATITGAPLAGFNTWAFTVNGPGASLANMLAVSEVLSELNTSSPSSSPSASLGLGPEQFIDADAIFSLSAADKQALRNATRARHQRQGTYASPFVYYGKPTDTLRCGGSAWPYSEILLKDSKGQYVQPLEGKLLNARKYITDSTHPGVECNIREIAESQIAGGGSSLIKFDFINFAAYESASRYNKTLAPTGMAAYAHGLKTIHDAVAGRAIISYSMALPFPHQWGHARRTGCDQMFGAVEYGMNQLAGGWWLGALYTWLDPDIVALEGDFWIEPQTSKFTRFISMDSRARVGKAVVAGGLLLLGDDLSNATQAAAVRRYLGNPAVNAMWRRGGFAGGSAAGERLFRPAVSALNAGWLASGVFARSMPEEEKKKVEDEEKSPFSSSSSSSSSSSAVLDLAFFNYAPWHRSWGVSLADVGMPGLASNTSASSVKCVEIWDNKTLPVLPSTGSTSGTSRSTLKVWITVPRLSSALVECRQE